MLLHHFYYFLSSLSICRGYHLALETNNNKHSTTKTSFDTDRSIFFVLVEVRVEDVIGLKSQWLVVGVLKRLQTDQPSTVFKHFHCLQETQTGLLHR